MSVASDIPVGIWNVAWISSPLPPVPPVPLAPVPPLPPDPPATVMVAVVDVHEDWQLLGTSMDE
jgi:hypothetical protein